MNSHWSQTLYIQVYISCAHYWQANSLVIHTNGNVSEDTTDYMFLIKTMCLPQELGMNQVSKQLPTALSKSPQRIKPKS